MHETNYSRVMKQAGAWDFPKRWQIPCGIGEYVQFRVMRFFVLRKEYRSFKKFTAFIKIPIEEESKKGKKFIRD